MPSKIKDLVNLPWSLVLKYPHQDEPAVEAVWLNGEHPKECRGKCEISTTGGILRCANCGLDEYSLL